MSDGSQWEVARVRDPRKTLGQGFKLKTMQARIDGDNRIEEKS